MPRCSCGGQRTISGSWVCLTTFGSGELNSDQQPWQQAPLPIEPPHQAKKKKKNQGANYIIISGIYKLEKPLRPSLPPKDGCHLSHWCCPPARTVFPKLQRRDQGCCSELQTWVCLKIQRAHPSLSYPTEVRTSPCQQGHSPVVILCLAHELPATLLLQKRRLI